MAKKEKKQNTDSTLEILSVDEYLKLEVGSTVTVQDVKILVSRNCIYATDTAEQKHKLYAGEAFACIDGLVYFGEELESLETQIKEQTEG